MHQLDSMSHIEICQTVIEVLQGDDILKLEKEELKEVLQRHIDLEKESIERAEKIMGYSCISENQGLNGLMRMFRDDDSGHHKALMKITDKIFFMVSPSDWVAMMGIRDLEDRYVKFEKDALR